MNRKKKFWLTCFLAGIMAVQAGVSAFASGTGPFFDANLNSDAPSPTEPADSSAAGQPSGEFVATDIPVRTNPNTLLIPVAREPRLQATILLNASNTWSQPFVNDQWCFVDNQTFYSISIFLENVIGNIHYRAYTSSNGWTNWAMNGQQTDIPADFAPIEAIQMRFSGPVRNAYDLYYTTYLNDGTEIGWGKNGTTAGTMQQGKALTGFRMAFFARDAETGLNTSTPVSAAHTDGVQYIDGAIRYISGDGSNYTGWGWVDNQRYYFVDSYPVTGWNYIDGYKYYFAEDGKLVDDLEPIIGANGPFLIRVNKQMNCMTIFVQDGANGYIIPLKTFLTSTGDDTPLGTFHTPEKYRWRLMIHDVYTQYATRLGSGLSILMHSPIYSAPNSFTLSPETYNYLGVARSAGCIRLAVSDCKWIYDHCPLGTTVEVYNSNIPGPYERPTIGYEISDLQTWDPTDPEVTPEAAAAQSARILGISQ